MEEDNFIVLCHCTLTAGEISSMFLKQQLLLQDVKVLSMTRMDNVAYKLSPPYRHYNIFAEVLGAVSEM